MKRGAKAVWNGSVTEGSGALTTQSTVLDNTQYSFKSRFEDGVGTNPEELLAAAHAGCFTMNTSALLGKAGFTAEKLVTDCKIVFENGKIVRSELSLIAKIPSITNEEFQKIVKEAEATCPVSVSFSFDIELVSVVLE